MHAHIYVYIYIYRVRVGERKIENDMRVYNVYAYTYLGKCDGRRHYHNRNYYQAQ